jgi:hypothetical protein
MVDRGPNRQAGARRGVVALIVIASFVAGAAYGIVATKAGLFPVPQLTRVRTTLGATRRGSVETPGRWRTAEGRVADLTEEQLREIERLTALGYVSGSVPAGPEAGVTVHEEARAHEGLNFLTSGHAPGAVLMDMDGRVLHEWAKDFDAVWPARDVPEHAEGRGYWRRAHLFENGDVLAIYEGLGLVKLDARSEILWSYDGLCHHDLFVADDGTIYTLEREAKLDSRFPADRPILEDYVTVLGPDGTVLRRVSLLSALWRSSYSPLMRRGPAGGDIFHTNTIEVLDGRLAHASPAFRAGNVLVSILMLDAIAVVDMGSEEVVWALAGLWHQQHQPTVLEDGRMLVFDNEHDSRAAGRVSRVVEIDPMSQEIHWVYEGTADRPFYTSTCGSNQRLPDGNTLITESDRGRAFEVARDGTIVWEFLSPYRAGEGGELVATLFEVVRLPRTFPLTWLEE